MIDPRHRERFNKWTRDFITMDLRRSYLIIAAMIVAGAIINFALRHEHGWTVWPFVGAAGALLMVNEAADRNGQGVPPMQVYALFGSAVASWLVIVFVLSAFNPLIDLIGFAGLAYYGFRGYLQQRERDRLIYFRRENRLCIHCGEPADPEANFCESCGNEPNPDIATMRRVAAIARSPEQIARTRAALASKPATAGAASKEAALLKRRPRQSTGRNKS